MSGKLIFGLDVGSSKIVSLVGALGDKVNILGFGGNHFVNNQRHNDFSMISNGLICEIERMGSKISQSLHESQIAADCSVGSVITNISGGHLRNLYSHSRQEMGSHSVTEDIIRYMVNEAKQVNIPNSYEIIDYEVQEYLIDDERYTINPLHLNCSSINANINIFVSAKTPVQNLRKAISYSNYEIAKITPSGILSGMAVLNREEKELGCCLIDIGAGTTDVIVYENGFIRYLASIPLGGEDITRDIASVLKVSRNLAEDLKLTNGICSGHSKSNGEGLSIIDHRGENIIISRKLLNDVILERVKDIFNLIKTQLEKNNLYDIINSGVVLTGGSAQLDNLKNYAAQYFSVPVRIGVPNYSGDFADIVCNPKYATAVGSLYFANSFLLGSKYTDATASGVEMSQIFKKFKNIFKNK